MSAEGSRPSPQPSNFSDYVSFSKQLRVAGDSEPPGFAAGMRWSCASTNDPGLSCGVGVRRTPPTISDGALRGLLKPSRWGRFGAELDMEEHQGLCNGRRTDGSPGGAENPVLLIRVAWRAYPRVASSCP